MKIKVTMRAEQNVTLMKTVMMDETDFLRYEHTISDRNISHADQDRIINEIASRYGLEEAQVDWEDMEDATFERESE